MYLDDIMIHSSNLNDHLEQVKEVLNRLSQVGLTLKLSKCVFGTDKCEYFGHEIGHSPLESKVVAVCEMPRPQTKKRDLDFSWDDKRNI